MATIFLSSFSIPLQRLICPVSSIGELKLGRQLFVEFSKCLKAYQSCGMVPRRLICISRIRLLNIWSTAYHFFVTVGMFV